MKNFKKITQIMMFGMAAAIINPQNVLAGPGDDLFTSEEAQVAMKVHFSLPLVFTTELGELTLTLENNPNEKNLHYMRPHKLPKPSDFMEFSHTRTLKSIQKVFQEEQDLTIKLLMESGNPLMEMESIYKKAKLLEDNPIYPLAYQTLKYDFFDRLSLPESVLHISWSFEEMDNPRHATDLNLFQDKSVFYKYVVNSLKEKMTDVAKQTEEDNFQSIRGSMYM